MAKIILIGTSHIAQQSVAEIKHVLQNHPVTLIAIELDAKRLRALLSKQQPSIRLSDIRRVGLKGFLFVLIGSYIQRRLGRMVGTAPGSDMLQAVRLAKEHNIPIALIDQDIEVTLRRFSQTLSWKERFRFAIDLFRGAFFQQSELKRYGLDRLDLRKVPPEQLIKRLTSQLKKRYPNIYKVLIEERNRYMINQLNLLAKQNPDATILVVVGAGHKDAIQQAFKKV